MRILVYDVAASSGGALSILTDFYQQVVEYGGDAEWHFVVSTPSLQEKMNIIVHRYPWVKSNPINRLFFDTFVVQKLVKKLKIDKILSLQNVCISRCSISQLISLHNALPFHKCDKTVLSSTVGIYKQRYLNKKIISSLRKAYKIFVPNDWIYNSCVAVKGVRSEKVQLIKPNISLPQILNMNNIAFDKPVLSFFYPANPEPYKRHDLIYKACLRLEENGYTNYNVFFTTRGDETAYIIRLKRKCLDAGLPVTFNGSIPREEVYARYCESVLLFPSNIETDALPIIEAMMCNAFIIATKTDFAECILKDYPNCLLIPVGDDVSLASAMQDVLEKKYSLVAFDKTVLSATGSKDGLVKAVLNS